MKGRRYILITSESLRVNVFVSMSRLLAAAGPDKIFLCLGNQLKLLFFQGLAEVFFFFFKGLQARVVAVWDLTVNLWANEI